MGAGYSKQVNLSNTTSGGVEINFKTTDRIETSKTGAAGVIGPGDGDVFYGENWDIHYKFINRSAWLGYDGEYTTTVGGKNNIIVGASSGVVRDLPSSAFPNTVVMVTLNVTVGKSTYFSIDETVPSGWKIVSASNGGDYTSTPGHVKWTVESYATDTILTYNISIPSNITGIYTFSGSYRFEGPDVHSIVGDDKITVDEVIPIIATREISKNQAVPGSKFAVKVSINISKDSSEVKNLYFLEVLPQGWNITSWNVPPYYILNGMAYWKWSNVNPGDTKTIIYNVTIPISADEKVQAISGIIGADIRLERYKLIDYDRVYQYYIVRSSEFVMAGCSMKQVDEPWRSQILSLDTGFDNFIDNNESKKVEKEKTLLYIATDSPISHSKSTTISNSSKLTFTMEVNETTAFNWDLDIIGISVGEKVITASSLYIGYTNYTKNTQNVESGYTIMDDDALPFGDSINMTIYYDKVFGTYLFITDTNTSYTVNPREPWTKSPLSITPTKGEKGDNFTFIAKMRKDLNKAEVRIQQPDQIDIATLQLFDDGMHGDGVSKDGIYGNSWNSAGAYGEYYVDVISWDGLNQIGKADNVATFDVFVDPPSSISNLNSTAGDSWINWTWNDPNNADFFKVMIYLDGSFKTNVSKGVQFYNATGFAPDTEHTIATKTVDTLGNINQTWVNHTARTSPPVSPTVSVFPNKTISPPNSSFTIDIVIDPAGSEVFSGQFNLFFNTTILNSTGITQGSFLSEDGATTIVIAKSIDNAAGKIEYGETRVGVANGIKTKGKIANVTFSVKPDAKLGYTSKLDLENVILTNPSAEPIPNVVVNDGVVEGEGLPPVAIAETNYTKNNVDSKAYLTGLKSYDGDGNIISYEWDFGDGTTGAGSVVSHVYKANNYAGYNVTLKVTDNTGLTNSTVIKLPVWIPGDANGDKTVNILDAAKAGIAWGKKYGEPNYDDGADLNNDNIVNIIDGAIIGINWGKIA